jgi:MoaA/NifB/PqqE/SkfB family radical SAM enzyme
MQSSHLKLKEIVWEITGKCNNHCSYCGSLDVNNKTLTDQEIYLIARDIADFPPKEIDISGGDPLTLSYALHSKIIDIFKHANIYCKILFNLKSLNTIKSIVDEKIKILKLYDWIGISINNLQDIEAFNEFKILHPEIKNYTIITNFNISNLYNYKAFESVAKKEVAAWMIQYTVYKDENDDLAIYNNDSALDVLKKNIVDSLSNSVKILISDNASNSKCGAGLQTIGITWDGYVIPCLSMRSWNDVSSLYQGKLGDEFLADIWTNKFEKYRFCDFKCCKDICKNKKLSIYIDPNEINKKIKDKQMDIHSDEDITNWINPNSGYDPFEPTIVMYAVQSDPIMLMYGVKPFRQIMAYAVTNKFDWDGTYTTTSTTNDCKKKPNKDKEK